ncbi:anhydro-N-acetylmuramic acid kinase [Gilvibacter sediminis]|uniref:anhydro-N-acetylmuramic acid kinase n=1 Tax=Gilvibacter sediminis TaxID=379071 RepID=UPI002350E06C|nr:anhydro-N-acetylmuramic acid kinase [Gilvibacter sediminis]MDC7997557.1 anhydro-N-acetylmuramic acid kinase [Gilvibacter sediminis]
MLKNQYHVLGVMSGTSLDGIDLAEVFFTVDQGVWTYEFGHTQMLPYDEKREKAFLADLVSLSPAELDAADTRYSQFLGEQIKVFIQEHNIMGLDAVCSHGHTALHRPDLGVTRQIGNQKQLADIIGQRVVCDFRVQDVVLGGQGAPLVPIGDRLLFGDYDYCINLGGFANLSYEQNGRRIAYDLCPVNIILNALVEPLGLAYDEGGKIAQSGTVNDQLLKQLNSLDYYAQQPPKSLGLEWVRSEIHNKFKLKTLNPEDALATLVEHMAFQISKPLKAKSKVLFTGGGAHNDYLLQRIESYKSLKIKVPNKQLIEYKEALIFALLGVLKLRDEVNCLASVTGARKDHSSGLIFNANI